MTYPPPIASPDIENIVRSTRDLGEVARARRKSLALKQADLASLASTGNRFVIDLEAGKPTL